MKRDANIQALLYPNPVMVVATYDEAGKANVATLAWGGVVSSGPHCVSISVRPSRYTYKALMEKKAFTLNLVSSKYVTEADYFGMVSGKDADKFAITKLTPIKSSLVDAPYIDEFPYALECKVIRTLDLGAHTLFIGEVLGVKVDDEVEGQSLWNSADMLAWDADSRNYFIAGRPVGKAFEIGKRFM